MNDRMARTRRDLAANSGAATIRSRPWLLVAHPSPALLDWMGGSTDLGPLTVVSTPQGADFFRQAADSAHVQALEHRGLAGSVRALRDLRRQTRRHGYGLALAGWAEGRPPTAAVIAAVTALKAPVKGVLLEDGSIRLGPSWRFPLLAARQRIGTRRGVLAALHRWVLLGLVYARLGLVLVSRGTAARVRGHA